MTGVHEEACFVWGNSTKSAFPVPNVPSHCDAFYLLFIVSVLTLWKIRSIAGRFTNKSLCDSSNYTIKNYVLSNLGPYQYTFTST